MHPAWLDFLSGRMDFSSAFSPSQEYSSTCLQTFEYLIKFVKVLELLTDHVPVETTDHVCLRIGAEIVFFYMLLMFNYKSNYLLVFVLESVLIKSIDDWQSRCVRIFCERVNQWFKPSRRDFNMCIHEHQGGTLSVDTADHSCFDESHANR